jgi:hypothetical protein
MWSSSRIVSSTSTSPDPPSTVESLRVVKLSLSAHKDLQIPATYTIDQVKTQSMEPDMAMVKEMQIESERYKEVAEVPNSPAYSLIENKERMKKEQQERAKVELIKVNYVLSVREVLSALLEEGGLEDLETGSNGAPKLSADQLAQIQQFQELATPNREDLSKGSFDKQVAASAEHLVNLAEKKATAVVGTTYQELAELIDLIRECGYVEAKWANDSTANTENGADDATQDTVEDEEEEEPDSGGNTTAMEEMSQMLVGTRRLDKFHMDEDMMTTTPKATIVENLQVKGKKIQKVAKKARLNATKDGTEEAGKWQLECTDLDCNAGVGGAPFKTPALMPGDALDYIMLHREPAHSYNVKDAKESALRIKSPNHQNQSLEKASQDKPIKAEELLSTEQPVVTKQVENRSKEKKNVTMKAITGHNETANEGLAKNYIDEKDRAEVDTKMQQRAEYAPLTITYAHFLDKKTANEFDGKTRLPIRFNEKDQVGMADRPKQPAVNVLTGINCVTIIDETDDTEDDTIMRATPKMDIAEILDKVAQGVDYRPDNVISDEHAEHEIPDKMQTIRQEFLKEILMLQTRIKSLEEQVKQKGGAEVANESEIETAKESRQTKTLSREFKGLKRFLLPPPRCDPHKLLKEYEIPEKVVDNLMIRAKERNSIMSYLRGVCYPANLWIPYRELTNTSQVRNLMIMGWTNEVVESAKELIYNFIKFELGEDI